MVENALSQIGNFPEEPALKLKHIILSHHGRYEHTSPRKPAFPEALLVLYLNELDARMDMMKTAIGRELDDGDWTSVKNYFRIPLYKPKKDEDHDNTSEDRPHTDKKP
ncbi:MAG: hypothetical protein U5N26_10625 [Candidatus Marinimicrobia bacterium]|nr:hypothetical protein [Candidatus Neomarinimicrobiota bacterium]